MRLIVFLCWVLIGAAFLLAGCHMAWDVGSSSLRVAAGEAAEKWPMPEGGLYESSAGTAAEAESPDELD